jgi:hypothetical protein
MQSGLGRFAGGVNNDDRLKEIKEAERLISGQSSPPRGGDRKPKQNRSDSGVNSSVSPRICRVVPSIVNGTVEVTAPGGLVGVMVEAVLV